MSSRIALMGNIEKESAENLLAILHNLHLTVATAESCTGGNIAHRITLVPGASESMLGGVVAYSNEVKRRLLGVSEASLRDYGAVSRQVVREMAAGVCEATGADVGISTSGIAGPGGATPGKPVGTVWMAVCIAPSGKAVERLMTFSGDRASVIAQATSAALSLAIEHLRR